MSDVISQDEILVAAAEADATATKVAYDENAIKTLDPLAHIRLRTGMYIGRIGDGSTPNDGIYVLLKEVIDNSIDEFIMGQGKRVVIRRDNRTISVRDYGRGIPLGKLVECVSIINTGGKYNDDVFQFSVGLNGVGTKAVNALSESFEVISYRDKEFRRALFSRGKLLEETSGTTTEMNGTFVRFTPDAEIFGEYAFNDAFIARRLRYYAYLNTGLKLVYYSSTGNKETFSSEDGLIDLLKEEIGETELIYDIVHIKADHLEAAFTHLQSGYGEKYFSFVNGQYTSDGGTHQAAFREGLLKGVNEYAQKNYAGEDVRECIVGAISIKIKDPVFESQTKNKLGSTEVKGWIIKTIKDEVDLWLHKNEEVAKALISKIERNEKLRKELSAVRSKAKELTRKTAIHIPKLTDSKFHFNDQSGDRREDTMIFLTEGDSAGGAMVQSRDVMTQAIFRLRGKVKNTYGEKRDVIYKVEELYNIMKALGVEDSTENLRYNKVVIATDADDDGMHIRLLLLTYFLLFFEDLVITGHIYILETPLFRVRNKKETLYCYTEAERDAAIKKLKGTPEVTRFKGLGEISPDEFKPFLGEKMRLIQVNSGSLGQMGDTLKFLMGDNTPKRRDFIMQNLISDIAIG